LNPCLFTSFAFTWLGSRARSALAAKFWGYFETYAKQRGDIAQACAHWKRARDLYRQIGAKPMVERVEGWMREAGCGTG